MDPYIKSLGLSIDEPKPQASTRTDSLFVAQTQIIPYRRLADRRRRIMSVPQIPGLKAEEPLAEVLRREVADLLRRNPVSFPGAQPVSFARKHIEELQQKDYYLCEKTDGIRCLLYATDDQGEEIHYLIDRKNDYYFIPPNNVHFPMPGDDTFQRFHKSTLLDGELVNDRVGPGPDDYRLRYLVFDCIVLDGDILTQKPLDKRLARFHSFVLDPYKRMFATWPQELEHQLFEVAPKSFGKPYSITEKFDELPRLAHGNDGLVFTCRETPYVFGTDENILKWKPAHENTIDFMIRLGEFPTFDPEEGDTGPVYDYEAQPTVELLVNCNEGKYAVFAELHLEPAEWEAMKSVNESLDMRIIECYKDEQGRWRPKLEGNGAPRFRDDKKDANHMSTVYKVIESINDAVSEHDLRAAEDAIRRMWKNRHPEEKAQQTQQAQQVPRVNHTPVANGDMSRRASRPE
ncbi:hypothetical protein W97_03596 [Coniosporium apollinis CBS 100218]|uniref:mRNA-capping enzyme subunit alpha n=1 Tax=Coniosporium apollinis (strain CBS 100218) TaxID=1168221 RepID=R7YR13_CONA1|nr:uncharacterized protein W97_03596 [Coniosporium apollinis CBS 100218]EON64365.1 hypothetical protein W97_03596 [Coniosporium apollinis CBS 100218]